MAKKKLIIQTDFGNYLSARSVNKAEVSRRTGLSTTRINRLCTEQNSYLRCEELQLIALAIKVDPLEMHRSLFGHLKLKEERLNLTEQEKIDLQISDLVKAKRVDLTTQDIKRISSILSFALKGKTDNEILDHLGLQRKSSNFIKTLKACVMIGWLDYKQMLNNEELVNTYSTTEKGIEILQVS